MSGTVIKLTIDLLCQAQHMFWTILSLILSENVGLEQIKQGFHAEPTLKIITKPKFELQLHLSLHPDIRKCILYNKKSCDNDYNNSPSVKASLQDGQNSCQNLLLWCLGYIFPWNPCFKLLTCYNIKHCESCIWSMTLKPALYQTWISTVEPPLLSHSVVT